MKPAQEAGTITAALAEVLPWLWSAADDLPAPVRLRTHRLWTDTAACAWSGLRAEPCQRWLALQAETDPGPVVLPGTDVRLGVGAGAFAFAMGACWDEACEGVAIAHGRPGVPIVAALWSQVGLVKPSWGQLWRATAVGYEVGARLGARLRIRAGQHVDGMWGAFGASAALAYLQGLSWQDALCALETCAVQLPYSLYQPIAQGANVRNMYLGHSTWLALQAVQAVRSGCTSPMGAIDEFARLALDTSNAAALEPAGRWWILDSYWKPYAGVRHLHYGAQAAIRLREQVTDITAVEALRLHIYPEAQFYCGNRNPQTALAAQFSLSFGVAAALVFGDLSPDEYGPARFQDPRLRRLEALLEVQPDPVMFPGSQRGARLEALVRGQWLGVAQAQVLGDPGHEPDANALARKFTRYTQGDAAMAAWSKSLHGDPFGAAVNWPDNNLRS